MHFLVLSPGHTAAHVAFHKILPVTVDETLQQIQAERCPDLCIRYPRLIPAYPQPCPGSGVVLAAPEWCSDEPVARCFLCLDTSAIDGRLFTVAGPPYLSRRHLLHLADLSSVPGIAVHAQGDPIPLDDTAQCHVYDGATFHFLALGAIMPTLFPLATELLSFRSWSPALTAPRSPPESQYCLVHENESILFTMQPGVPTSYRSQIAACLGFTRDRLRLFPANPRISDASLQGYACRSAIAVCEMPRHMPAAAHAVLVDARALLAGWRSYDTVAGRFSCVDALANLRETLPAGWQAVLADFPPHVDLVDTAPGQVIVALAARTPRVVPPLGVTLAAGDRDLSQHRVSGDHPLPTSESAPSGGSTAGDLPDHTHPTGSSDVGTSSNTRHNQPILYHTCVFLVLGQNYTPEMIEVRLAAGTDVQDAMRLVAAARSPRDAALLPGLVPVHPQPCLTHGLAISVPSWPCPGALVAFDLRPIGGSAFALHLAGHMSRQDLLQAAQIDEDFQGEIFVGSLPWPLLADMRILLVTGDLVIFRPVNDVHHCVASLSDMLHAPEAWNGAYDPTAEWGNDADKYAHLPAQDLAYCGAPVRGIFAVSADAHVSTARRTQEVHCFIDARPVLLHVSSLFCTRNLLDVAAVISRYAPRCPPAWEVCLLRSNMRRIFAEDDPRVTAGEVIIVTFQMHSGPSAMPGLVRTESTDEDAHDAEPDTEDHEDPIPSSNDPILPNPCGYLADTGGTRLDTDSGRTQGHLVPDICWADNLSWSIKCLTGHHDHDARAAGHPTSTPDTACVKIPSPVAGRLPHREPSLPDDSGHEPFCADAAPQPHCSSARPRSMPSLQRKSGLRFCPGWKLCAVLCVASVQENTAMHIQGVWGPGQHRHPEPGLDEACAAATGRPLCSLPDTIAPVVPARLPVARPVPTTVAPSTGVFRCFRTSCPLMHSKGLSLYTSNQVSLSPSLIMLLLRRTNGPFWQLP